MDTTALAIAAPGELRLERRTLREPAEYLAVVRIRYGGICGSDLHYWREGRVGTSVLRDPMVLGHEVVGLVEHPAADGSGPSEGAAVFVHPASFCGRCGFCRAGRRNLCEHLRYLGSAARRPHTDGAFASRVVVPSERLLPLGSLDLERGALIEPAAVAWHAVDRLAALGEPVAGRRIAVLGSGPIGLLVTAVLVHHGAGAVAATDIVDRALGVAASLGASSTLRADDAEIRAALAAFDPEAVIESSGVAASFAQGLDAVRRGGVLVALGQLPPVTEAAFARTVTDELRIVGSSRFAGEAGPVIDALTAGALHVDGVVSHRLPAVDYDAASALALDASRSSKVLLDFADLD